jgi:nucleotide-binding universal stress UspA family protein
MMNDKHAPSAVVVGIDGSPPAIRAAQWAIDEAVSRSVPLRLVYVTKPKHPPLTGTFAFLRAFGMYGGVNRAAATDHGSGPC